MPIRLALNRTCPPQLSLADFIALARQTGVKAVEIRNDIEGQEFHDGTPAAEVKARLDEAGLAVASVNALQRFNEWSPHPRERGRGDHRLCVGSGCAGCRALSGPQRGSRLG